MSRGRPRYGHACEHTQPRYRRWAQVLGGTARAGRGRHGSRLSARGWACWARKQALGRAGRQPLGRQARGRWASECWRGARGMSGRRRYGRPRPRYGPARLLHGAEGLHDTAMSARLGVPGRAWCAGWANWGLMQPVLFLIWVFNSVVFLSHRLDSVHEHCS